MAVRKSQDALRINVSQTDPRQSRLVEYLRKSGQITSLSMEAIESYWYSYALAADPQASDIAVEMAVAESVIGLSSQINRILNFHRLDRQIVLPNEVLTRCGLIPRSEPVVSPAKSEAILPPIVRVGVKPAGAANCAEVSSAYKFDKTGTASPVGNRPTAADIENEHSEAEDVRQTHAGLKLSPSVASFLYGES